MEQSVWPVTLLLSVTRETSILLSLHERIKSYLKIRSLACSARFTFLLLGVMHAHCEFI